MATFYNLKVKDVKQETNSASSIYFEIPEDLKEIFSYKHGQYLTLKLNIDGKNVNRAYSLCTSPYVDPYPAVTSKRVEGGLVSNYLNDHIKPGDSIEVFPPLGKFTSELNANRQQSYVLIAGGSGITPMMSILKSVLDQEPASMIFLLYGNLNN
jgi:ring-1,2-phenylacetyl-CoA epoxidase subunit PaaE